MPNPSRKEIWKMFDRISPTYDRINRVVSLGRDIAWRRKLASHLPTKNSLHVLDIATGTGDQLMALFKECPNIEKATGIDLASDMLKIAEKKFSFQSYGKKISLKRADAEKIPFGDKLFDAATLSFGIRNVSSPSKALSEIYRVLKPKGRCLILEFSLPPQPIRKFYLFYLRYLIPFIGGFFSKDKEAYRYLNETIESFPYGKEFALLMKNAGFSHIQIFPMSLGAVSLYIGTKS